MTYKTARERSEAILESKRAYWNREQVRLRKKARQRYEASRPVGWVDGRRKAAQARVPVSIIEVATTNVELRAALLEIQDVQEKVLQHTHASLRLWSSGLAKSLLERQPASAARLLGREKRLISSHFSRITSCLSLFDADSALYELAVKMGTQTREAEGCLLDLEEKLESGELLNCYVHRTLYADLYAS